MPSNNNRVVRRTQAHTHTHKITNPQQWAPCHVGRLKEGWTIAAKWQSCIILLLEHYSLTRWLSGFEMVENNVKAKFTQIWINKSWCDSHKNKYKFIDLFCGFYVALVRVCVIRNWREMHNDAPLVKVDTRWQHPARWTPGIIRGHEEEQLVMEKVEGKGVSLLHGVQ